MALTYLLAVPTMGASPGLGWGHPHRVSGGGGLEEPGPEAQDVWPSAGAVWPGSGPGSGSGLGWGREGPSYFGNKTTCPVSFCPGLVSQPGRVAPGSFLREKVLK